jgi:multiple sugar transport system permease protein
MVTGRGRIEQVVRVWLPIGFFLVVALFPFYWMAITSIKPNAELYNKNVMPLIVHAPTLKHYVDLLTKSSFLLWTWNTMLVAVVATAISLVLGTMLAYPLARMRFAGASLIAMTIAAIYLVPQPLHARNNQVALGAKRTCGELRSYLTREDHRADAGTSGSASR